MTKDPFQRFSDVYARALKTDLPNPNAFALATSTPDGAPSVRMLLLKGFDERGFVFYTNLGSRKGIELAQNTRASMCFFWDVLHEQVRVEGRVHALSDEEADAYFTTRDRGSQIGAWASRQSEPMPNAGSLMAEVVKVGARYLGKSIPRPPHWSGFRLAPESIEFWVGKKSRLHERHRYRREGDEWRVDVLFP